MTDITLNFGLEPTEVLVSHFCRGHVIDPEHQRVDVRSVCAEGSDLLGLVHQVAGTTSISGDLELGADRFLEFVEIVEDDAVAAEAAVPDNGRFAKCIRGESDLEALIVDLQDV